MIPDRWLNYSPIGSKISGTRFVAFKVPLKSQFNYHIKEIDKRFDELTLLRRIPNLGLIIDLTNTCRYYEPTFFEKSGVKYEKILVEGHKVPDMNIRNKFSNLVNEFLEENKNSNKLIGVHCTHGVNRTGFLICHFMINELNINPKEAIEKFGIARGYPIERDNYIDFLSNLKITCNEKTTLEMVPIPKQHTFTEYVEKRNSEARQLPYNSQSRKRSFSDRCKSESTDFSKIQKRQNYEETNYNDNNRRRRISRCPITKQQNFFDKSYNDERSKRMRYNGYNKYEHN